MTKYSWIIQVLMALVSWYDEASKDKIIEDHEIAELLTEIAKITDLKIKL